jgi:hypothetical protein
VLSRGEKPHRSKPSSHSETRQEPSSLVASSCYCQGKIRSEDCLLCARASASARLIDSAVAVSEKAHLPIPSRPARTRLEWLLEEVGNGYHPIKVPVSVLKQYVDQYDDTQVLLEDECLIYRRRFFRYRLIPLTGNTFWLDGPAAGFEARIEFTKNESGVISQLVGYFPDGRSITHQRQAAAQ